MSESSQEALPFRVCQLSDLVLSGLARSVDSVLTHTCHAERKQKSHLCDWGERRACRTASAALVTSVRQNNDFTKSKASKIRQNFPEPQSVRVLIRQGNMGLQIKPQSPCAAQTSGGGLFLNLLNTK